MRTEREQALRDAVALAIREQRSVDRLNRIYSAQLDDGDTVLLSSVEEVCRYTGRNKRSVQVACKEAREEGVSHFLD